MINVMYKAAKAVFDFQSNHNGLNDPKGNIILTMLKSCLISSIVINRCTAFHFCYYDLFSSPDANITVTFSLCPRCFQFLSVCALFTAFHFCNYGLFSSPDASITVTFSLCPRCSQFLSVCALFVFHVWQTLFANVSFIVRYA